MVTTNTIKLEFRSTIKMPTLTTKYQLLPLSHKTAHNTLAHYIAATDNYSKDKDQTAKTLPSNVPRNAS